MIKVLEDYKNWATFTKNLSPKTIYGNINELKYIFKNLSFRPSLTETLSFLTKLLQQGKSPYHIKRIRSALYSYCEYLISKNKIEKNWAKEIPVPKIIPRIPEILSVEEIEKIINFPIRKGKHGESDRFWNLFFELLAKTGMRLGELRNLLVSDLNLTEQIITIRMTKIKEPRIIPIPPDMIEKLKRWIGNKKPNDYLFPGRSSPICEGACQEELRERAITLGINKRVHPHIFRHSFITELLRQDVSISKVQRIVGHRNLKTTMIYTHLLIDDLKWAMFKHPLIKKNISPQIAKKEIENFLIGFKGFSSSYKLECGDDFLKFVIKF